MFKFVNYRAQSEAQAYLLLGLIFFTYALSVGLAIQLYFVPTMFPHFNLGDGLIILDSTGFNQIAKAKAIEIMEKGWRAWELRPQMHSPAGIASIFYTLWTPQPFSLLPFNALVHALSGCLVLWLLRRFFSWGPAIFGSAFFVFNPAALEWVAQIHRDGVFILGNLMVLVCLMQLGIGFKSERMRTMVWGFILGLIGTCLVWVARPQWVHVLFVSLILCTGLIVIYGFATRSKRSAK